MFQAISEGKWHLTAKSATQGTYNAGMSFWLLDEAANNVLRITSYPFGFASSLCIYSSTYKQNELDQGYGRHGGGNIVL